MKFSDNRGIKTGQWLANEILRSDDLNFLNQCGYQNGLDALRLRAKQETVDEVIAGLELTYSTSRTFNLQPGAALSFTGKYFSSDAWGFSASAGDAFMAVVPAIQAVGFDAGGTYDRIDIVEIRPIQNSYNNVPRQFKDPVTGLVTSSLMNTRLEYSYEFAVRKGAEGTIRPESWTWSIVATTTGANVKSKYILFSTHLDDYYLWFNTDGTGTDPLVSGRTGIPVTPAAADDYIALAGLIQSQLSLYTTELTATNPSSGVVTCVGTMVMALTDATNGDVGALFNAISITQGNGPLAKTAGWIKIAEVYVAAGASTLSQSVMKDYRTSHTWYQNASETVSFANNVGSVSGLPAKGDRIPPDSQLCKFNNTLLDQDSNGVWDVANTYKYVANPLYGGSAVTADGADGYLKAYRYPLRLYKSSESQWSIGFRLKINSLPGTAKELLTLKSNIPAISMIHVNDVGGVGTFKTNQWTTNNPNDLYALKQDSTHIISLRNYSTAIYAERASISDMTITWSGSPASIGGIAGCNDVVGDMLDATSFAILYNAGTGFTIRARIGTLSGDTISWGTEFDAAGISTGTGGELDLIAMDATHFVGVWFTTGAGTVECRYFTNTGGTITAGGYATIFTPPKGVAPAANIGYTHKLCQLDATTFAVVWLDTDYVFKVKIGTISGTTITFGSAYTVETGGYIPYSIKVVKISSTKFMITWSNQTGQDPCYTAFTIATIPSAGSTTVTVNQEYRMMSDTMGYSIGHAGDVVFLNDREFIGLFFKYWIHGFIDDNNKIVGVKSRAFMSNANAFYGSYQSSRNILNLLDYGKIVAATGVTGSQNPGASILRFKTAQLTLKVDSTNFTLELNQDAGVGTTTRTRTSSTGIHDIAIIWSSTSMTLMVDGSLSSVTIPAAFTDYSYTQFCDMVLNLLHTEGVEISDFVIDKSGVLNTTRYISHNSLKKSWNNASEDDLILAAPSGGEVRVPIRDEAGKLYAATLEKALIEVSSRSISEHTALEDVRRGQFVYKNKNGVRNRIIFDTKDARTRVSAIISNESNVNNGAEWLRPNYSSAWPDVGVHTMYRRTSDTLLMYTGTVYVQTTRRKAFVINRPSAADTASALDVSSYRLAKLDGDKYAIPQIDASDSDAYLSIINGTSLGARGTTEATITASAGTAATLLTWWNLSGGRGVHAYYISGTGIRARVFRYTGTTVSYVGAAATILSGKVVTSVLACFPIAPNKFVVLYEQSTDSRIDATVCTVDASDVISVEGTTTIFSSTASMVFNYYIHKKEFYLFCERYAGSQGDRQIAFIAKYANPGFAIGSDQYLGDNFGGLLQGGMYPQLGPFHPTSGQMFRLYDTLAGTALSIVDIDWDSSTVWEEHSRGLLDEIGSRWGLPLFLGPYKMATGGYGRQESMAVGGKLHLISFGGRPIGVALNNAKQGEKVLVKTHGVAEVGGLTPGRKYYSGLYGEAVEDDMDYENLVAGIAVNSKELKLLI